MNRFKTRTTCPSKSNPYYISTKNGGYSQCIRPQDYSDGVVYSNGSALANCVGYACGRFNEIFSEITKFESMRYPELNCNAEGFINRAKSLGLEISSVPTLGGILVWQKGATLNGSDGAGHVAIVEEIIDNKTIYTSESDYGYKIYHNVKRNNLNGRWGLGTSFKFLGCIINPAVGAVCTFDDGRNEFKKQIEVSIDNLRVRTLPSLRGEFIGYCSKGILTYIDKFEADGFTWYKLDENKYVAGVDAVKELSFNGYELPKPISRDTSKRQVKVTYTNLRVRNLPSTNDTQILGICTPGIYNIYETASNSYTWYRIGESSWIAQTGSGVEELTEENIKGLYKLTYDPNYEYRWSVDGNKYGDKYDVTTLAYHGDEKLKDWEEVLAVNGGLFYTWDNQHFANGVEKSRGVNNQDISMSAVSDYNNAMSIGCTYDGKLIFAKQSYIINHLDDYYGAVTGMGLLLNGKNCSYGHTEFKSQWECISGRTILGEDKDGNYMSYSFAGVTGKSGLTGPQVQAKCKELGFYNAIMLDGGGSVCRRYFGKNIETTSRKIKNSVHLYRKKLPEKPDVKPDIDLAKALEEANNKINELSELNSNLTKDVNELKIQLEEEVNKNTLLTTHQLELEQEVIKLQSKIDESINILKS